MRISQAGRMAATASLALLVAGLGVGVPVQGHAHHEADEAHLGSPEHAHGLALVQHDMRMERASSPVFLPPEGRTAHPPASRPTVVADLPSSDEGLCESRAPPDDARPRAPPA